jgi:D-arabinose 1-dehydrogenase-like Zn-dependent alcohol dehydrogenase
MGFKTVALSSGDSKRALATELGAHVYVDGSKEEPAAALQSHGGAAVIAATAPNAKIIGPLIHGLGINGKLLLLALSEDITIPVGEFCRRQLISRAIDKNTDRGIGTMIVKRQSVIGWPVGSPQESGETLQFAQQAGVRCMVTKFSLDKAQEAYDHLAQARFRAVIIPFA